MNILFRAATRDDLEIILYLLKKETSFFRYIGDEKPEIKQRVMSKHIGRIVDIIEEPENVPLIIALDGDTEEPVGYFMYELTAREAYTDNLIATIYDSFVEARDDREEIIEHFLLQGEVLAEEIGCKRLVLELPMDKKKDGLILKKNGFYIEMNRIYRAVTTHKFDGPRQKNYRTRFAKESDRNYMLLLTAQNSKFLIPPGQEDESEKIQRAYLEYYAQMKIEPNPASYTLMVEDVNEEIRAGFIVIHLNPDDVVSARPAAYMFDISVQKEFWGKFVAQRLVREAENVLHKLRVGYFFADTAQSNPRPLMTALKTLGFSRHSQRWAKPIC